MDYLVLTVERQQDLLRDRLRVIEQEHFNHEVNKVTAAATLTSVKGKDKAAAAAAEEQVRETADYAQQLLEQNHAAVLGELQRLEGEQPSDGVPSA